MALRRGNRAFLSQPAPREFLLDVSRLVWRAWRGQLPTGIDRVCLAYLDHFGPRSQAVVQRGGFQFVLSPGDSDRLFELLRDGSSSRRLGLLRLAALGWPGMLRISAQPGTIYLNVGHTGLNETSLPDWISRHRLRAVYLVHDLIPLTHPEFCRPGENEKHRRRMRNVLATAAGVIGNSQTTIDELAVFARASGAKMPPATAAWIAGCASSNDVRPRALTKPYFVALGTIEGRKNHQLLLDGWRRLVTDWGQDCPKLVIIGQRGWQAEHVFAQLDHLEDLEGHVLELGKCDDRALAGWLAGARALLMPSFAEGFGLPIIEALQLGTPVVASSLPVFREIAGEIPTYHHPANALAWEQTIRAFTNDDPERDRQLAQIKNYRSPDWNTHFAIVERWLRTL